MKNLCKTLRIHQNISTAYHPRTDGQSERTNQWLEQYLRFWCDEMQNDWHKYLPMAEFAHNQMPSATTKKSPYELIMGYTPKVEWVDTIRTDAVPAVMQRIEALNYARGTVYDNIMKAQRRYN